MSGAAIELAERGMLPLATLRLGVRSLLRDRLVEAETGHDLDAFVRMLEEGPVAVETEAANEQHYEVPAAFYEHVLGPHLKYSGAFWPAGIEDLAGAEAAMLDLTRERAALADGQDILELGCGWGSLTLHMARTFPGSRITAVSNSASQRRFIEARAPENVRVITADMRTFDPGTRFDRVVSVEMFEHMRNLPELLRRISGWLRPEGKLFVHVFCHRTWAYLFETEGSDDWMGRHFFTGGMMPSFDLLPSLQGDLALEESWRVDGTHYQRTAAAWRENLEAGRDQVMPVLRETYGPEASVWFQRWRLFFLACEELFGYRKGEEWLVGHYRFRNDVMSG
ncbi:MAG: cyclopropane-fatty-acyl-phospholipid synthase family protein [Gemmatimonadota bacterium]